jgi:4-amino-4-deoxy-L-arabinose transferase-like glycosyltransferase
VSVSEEAVSNASDAEQAPGAEPSEPAPAAAAAPAAPAPPAVTARWKALLARVPEVWRDHAIGASIALVFVVWLLATSRDLGFSRDEGFYFRAAMDYSRWFTTLFEHPADAMKRSVIDGVWSENHEHPSLMKSLFALSWMFLHQKHHVFEDASTAFRFPTMLTMGLTVWVTYLFGARAYSRRAGVIAAVLVGLMPNVFYNAHLACFDVPIMAMWTATIYVYWRSLERRSLLWAIAMGVVYGLTLDTKHNAWILPAVLIPHAVFVHRRAFGRELRVGRFPIPLPLVAMATIGPLVFVALWPWMWNDTLPRAQEWLERHLNHEYYNMEYFHVNYFGPPSPRSYMPFMILATVPTVTLVLFAIGAASRATTGWQRLRAWFARTAPVRGAEATRTPAERPRPGRGETDLLFFLAIGVAVGPWFLPKTPIFGGTKHWLTAYPFLALFAGHGFDRVTSRLRATMAQVAGGSTRLRWAAEAALAIGAVAAPLAITAHSHPFGLSSYVPLIGGTAGGADLGLNRQFWGFTTESLAPYFDEHAARGATVYFNDTAWDSWARMIDERRIRPDLRGVGTPTEAEIAFVHIELHMMEVEYKIWQVFGTDTPDYVLTHDGVPIIDVFRRR